MTLLLQPDDGVEPVVSAITAAKRSINMTIFRCDLKAVERALAAAVERGVAVHALIAHTNRLGEKQLRQLELRLLGAGITVSRTSDDLVRYHDKILIIDNRTLHVLAFNLTRADTTKSRTMGIVTRQPRLVHEATNLFEADAARQPFVPTHADLVVSPLNARARLVKLVAAARRELWIYDPRLLDAHLIRLLLQRAQAGVDVRVMGRVSSRGRTLPQASLHDRRLHLRAILRDGRELFVGSQSLRPLELDRRREVGIIVRDAAAIKRFRTTFEADWSEARGATSARGDQASRIPA
jgi:cardiolipin synthase